MKSSVFSIPAALLSAVILLTPATQATASERLSNAAALSVNGSIMLSQGTLEAVTASGEFVVSSITTAGEFVVVALEDAAGSLSIAVTASVNAGGVASLAIGNSVQVVAHGAGHMLVFAGEAIGWVPATVADSLFSSSRRGGN